MQNNNQTNADRGKLQNRIGFILLVLIVIWFVSQLLYSPLLDEGSAAPDWKLPLAGGSGKSLELKDLYGRVVVIDFWSTTCPPCLREHEELNAISWQVEELGAIIVGIAAGGETVSEVEEFQNKRHTDFQLVVDSGTTAANYRVHSLPTLYIVNKQGKISTAHRGFWDRQSILRAVRLASNQP
ncbi:MAG: TlpA family protein disulfide reductase [Proteobacteria bacterium]|nr:TlpA family protein disulfide reductase [Pseudomonadota bacterium]